MVEQSRLRIDEDLSSEVGDPSRGIRNVTRSFALQNRFRDNGISSAVLLSLRGTSSEVDPDDSIMVDQIAGVSFKPEQITIDFSETGQEQGMIDRLASKVKRINVIVDQTSAFGFRVVPVVDTDLVDMAPESDVEQSSHVDVVLDAIKSSGKRTLSFQLAQQLGHTLAMRSLRSSLEKEGVLGIEFAIPNPDNLKLPEEEFSDGRALPWRQLFEPGYSHDQSLVFPMDPSNADYVKTTLMTAILNRHIIALSCAALANGHDVVLFNDARHEGIALFKAVSDWAIANRVTGKLHTFHLGYLAMDPVLSLPPKVTEQLLKSQQLLSEQATRRFPGIQVADGVEFMTWKMQAQLMLQAESDPNYVAHHLLYQSSSQHDRLNLSLIPEDARKWFQNGKFKVIPEVAATVPKDDGVKTIAVSVGTSGHSAIRDVIRHVEASARENPEITVILMGKGTDIGAVSTLIEDIPANLHCMGIVPKEEHDSNLAIADTIVTKTSRNSRNNLIPSILSGQGIILLPPESPQDIPGDISLFELSYLRETLMEHALDLMTALQVLESLGIKGSDQLLWQGDSDLLSLAQLAKQKSLRRSGNVMTPDSLAEIIMESVGK